LALARPVDRNRWPASFIAYTKILTSDLKLEILEWPDGIVVFFAYPKELNRPRKERVIASYRNASTVNAGGMPT